MNPLLVQVGALGGTPVFADLASFNPGYTVTVTLLQDYTPLYPAGLPTRPSYTGVAGGSQPSLIANGSAVVLHEAEALAIIAAAAGAGLGMALVTESGEPIVTETGAEIVT